MNYAGEEIIKALCAKLDAELPDVLSEVEVKWNADPIDLGKVYEYLFGHHPTLLEHPPEDYPIVSVMLTSSRPSNVQADQWYGQVDYELFIDTVVGSNDETEISKKSLRFIEAILKVLSGNVSLGVGAIQQNYVPTVELSEVLRQLDQNSKEFFTQQSRIGIGVES